MTRPSTHFHSSGYSVSSLLSTSISTLLSILFSVLLCLPVKAADPEGMPDLSDPEQLLDAYIRTVGDTSGKEVLLYASVVVLSLIHI